MKIWRAIENELYKLKIQLFSIYNTKTFSQNMDSILLLLKQLDLDKICLSKISPKEYKIN